MVDYDHGSKIKHLFIPKIISDFYENFICWYNVNEYIQKLLYNSQHITTSLKTKFIIEYINEKTANSWKKNEDFNLLKKHKKLALLLLFIEKLK